FSSQRFLAHWRKKASRSLTLISLTFSAGVPGTASKVSTSTSRSNLRAMSRILSLAFLTAAALKNLPWSLTSGGTAAAWPAASRPPANPSAHPQAVRCVFIEWPSRNVAGGTGVARRLFYYAPHRRGWVVLAGGLD